MPFQVDVPAIDETPGLDERPDQLVKRLSREKAQAVAGRHRNALVIGSDQVADLNGEILTKPGDHAAATRQLRRLSRQSVTFRTGLCLTASGGGRTQLDVVNCSVRFRHLGAREIERYLRREQPYDCAGSFRCEGLGIALIEALSGEDPNALIGLPLILLVTMLSNEGVSVL